MPRSIVFAACAAAVLLVSTFVPAEARPPAHTHILDQQSLAERNFGADAPWFLANIPFLEIDDSEIQQIYFYRWKLYQAHLRDIGAQGTVVTEFLDAVTWERKPWSTLNDSSSFHLSEGRWLRHPDLLDPFIDYLYTGGGNDRHFSESIAAATWSRILVTGDPSPGLRHLDAMQHVYNLWDDHLDRTRNLYWIEPLLDATEYTISSTDASGAGFTDHPSTDQNRNGFTGGFAFRPSINSYQFANAEAIAHLASLAGQPAIAREFTARAERLRRATLDQLWNPALQHFTDRYQRSTSTVHTGDFIRGRELVGFVPWFYKLPPTTDATYTAAWQHILRPAELAGPFGLRTVEPTYPRYLEQYRYEGTAPECQWNGPSWPFQTSQLLTAMANLLNDYPQRTVTPADYLRLLRKYTHQHLLQTAGPAHPDLQEDYNPDTGRPIVGLPRSHHYNHSTYLDLIVAGLIGLRPRADNLLEVNPLLHDPQSSAADSTRPIRYFCLEDLIYHGHSLTVLYDLDGSHYHHGRGLTLFLNGRRIAHADHVQKLTVAIPPPAHRTVPVPINLAVNVEGFGFPKPSASTNTSPAALFSAIDGRQWFFPEISNGWQNLSPTESTAPTQPSQPSWYALDLGRPQRLGSLSLAFFADGHTFNAPAGYSVEVRTAAGWTPVSPQHQEPAAPIANGENHVTFSALTASKIRISFKPAADGTHLRLIELKAFAP